ncbi:MAG: C4-dicarboxylate ABC transporter substrate-binding protein [Gammaproteobacteria bacterium]|nr:MAG: C4-dicarboxylate ABC transporter substrate-binding protein [Gammaproteobacteria bacterium]
MNIFKSAFAILGALLFSAVSFAGTKWDMPTPYGDGVHHTKNIRLFAEDIKKATGGELNIVVHSGASLIKHPEILRAVKSSQVQIGEIFMGLLANDNPIFKADNIPFLAPNFDAAKKLYAASKADVEKHLAKQGLKLLFAVPWPPQGFYTKKVINSVSDIKGMKLRAYSPTTSRLAVLLKATPTTVQTPEIPQAFSTGIIDAMVTSPSTGVSSQAWDFVSNYTDTQAWIPKNMIIVNSRAFKKLDKKIQSAVLDAAVKAEARGWEMAQQETSAKTATLKEKGMKVSKPSDSFQKELQLIGKTMGDEWVKETGDSGKVIIKALK